MTTLEKTSRSDLVRQRRTPQTRTTPNAQRTTQTARQVYHPGSVSLPVTARTAAHKSAARTTKKSHRNGYDIAFTLGRTSVHAPVLNIPNLGSRWISVALTLFLGFTLYIMSTASPFKINTAEVRGNQRLGAAEIYARLGMNGQPIFNAVPALMEANLLTAYPDLESVKVRVGFPNHITVDVAERIPVLAWYENGVVTWIDANGVAFMPIGEVPGLVQVAANDSPLQASPDPALPLNKQIFIAPEMVQALKMLAQDVPAGMPITYDPQFGIGWQDPRGWSVYFGQNTNDISMKKVVYQAIVDTLTNQGVQPSLISVEYLNAPFYK